MEQSTSESTAQITATLLAHPALPCHVPHLNVAVTATRTVGSLLLHYTVTGDTSALVVPPPVHPQRRDELWKHTCAELFIAEHSKPGYCEFNFSPSGEWAAYSFTDYRKGMHALEVTPPVISVWRDATTLRMSVQCGLPISLQSASVLQLGMTMVIEETQGSVAYWALKHPANTPDFHDRAGFVLAL